MLQLCTGMLQGHRGAGAWPKTMSEIVALCIDFRTPLCARWAWLGLLGWGAGGVGWGHGKAGLGGGGLGSARLPQREPRAPELLKSSRAPQSQKFSSAAASYKKL